MHLINCSLQYISALSNDVKHIKLGEKEAGVQKKLLTSIILWFTLSKQKVPQAVNC